MKVGILTHCIANNFGANLQALSTAMYFRNHGIEPVFFFWDSYLVKRSVKIHPDQLKMHRMFLSSFGFEVTEPCVSDEDFVSAILSRGIKSVVVGSDAVFTYSTWLDRIDLRHFRLKDVSEDKMFPNPFWVPFASKLTDCKFIYLSPSCQSTIYKLIDKKTKYAMKKQMKYFSYYSARDRYTQEMMHYILDDNIQIPITPDPVWGFSSNVKDIPNKQQILKKYGLKENYILMSFYKCPLSDVWIEQFRALANKDNIEVYSFPMPQGYHIANLPQIDLPIDSLDWFALIKYSCGYVGHNMHPIIVAMHNRVPFFSIDNHGMKIIKFFFEKSSKVYDLMDRFSFHEQRVSEKRIGKYTHFYVYNRLRNFDKKKCDDIAKNMELQYFTMMKDICNIIMS